MQVWKIPPPYTLPLLLSFISIVATAGCSAVMEADQPDLAGTLGPMQTQVAAQSTQLAKQEELLLYLATRVPQRVMPEMAPKPTPFVQGVVEIEEGKCCVGGVAGETISIQVSFQASSPMAEVTEMRLRSGGAPFQEENFSSEEWEPYAREKSFEYQIPLNWTGFYVTAQFRDAEGNLSAVVSDDISVEGSPARTGSPTP